MFTKLLAALAVALAYVAFLALLHTPLVQTYPVIGAMVLVLVMFAVFLAVLKTEPRRYLLRRLGVFFRRRAAPVGVILLGGIALAACNGVGGLGLPGGTDQAAILNAVNAHIEGCERHYHGQTVPPSLSVQIDCPARPGGAPLTAGTTVAAPTTLPQ